MKEKILNFFIKSIFLLISVIIGALIYKLIIKDCINIFITINLNVKKGIIIYNFFKLTTVMMIYSSFLILLRKKTCKFFKIFIAILYIGTMILLLFARFKIDRGFNLNPVQAFYTLHNKRDMMYFIGNIVFFMPIGYMLRKDNIFKVIILSISLELNIELLQYVFKRGYFDLSDIFINMIGIFIAYLT
ncbi:VanZ family protein, partial [Clostridium tarantellae]